MKFSNKKPLFFWILTVFFPADWDSGTIVTYGQTVYSKHPLSNQLVAHEGVHTVQQVEPFKWWVKYITDKQFRFEQELEAHIAEYKASWKTSFDLEQIASRLASPFYGNLISSSEARSLIVKGSKVKS